MVLPSPRLRSVKEGARTFPRLSDARADTVDAEVRWLMVRVPADLVYFDGHFPGHPVVAGVVQLNDLVLRAVRETWPDLRGLRRILRLKFRRVVGPEEVLSLHLERVRATSRVTFSHAAGDAQVGSGVLEFEP